MNSPVLSINFPTNRDRLKWLENFACKTNLSWWIFALAGLLALGIALLTVSWSLSGESGRQRGTQWRRCGMNDVNKLRITDYN